MKYSTYKTLHNWFGLVLLVPVSLTALTGILWMHEKSLGLKPDNIKEMKSSIVSDKQLASSSEPFAASNALATINQDSTKNAIDAAREVWGPGPVEFERLEFKQDPSHGLVVKIASRNTPATTPHEIIWSVARGEIVDRKGSPKLANGQGGTDWAKIVHDLHTGKFFSSGYGFLWSDFGGGAILFLSITGVVLYLMPIWKKRANQQKRRVSPAKPVVLVGKELSVATAKSRPRVVNEDELLDESETTPAQKAMELVN